MNDKANHTPLSISLCLSGGGFRATFFHLGVISVLREARLLGQVKYICSVSGGSILAASLAINWKDYVRPSDDAAFYNAVLPLMKLGESDLRGRIVRRWLLLGWICRSFRRTRLLERYYARLLSDWQLSKLPDTPEFYFLATSLTTGRLVSFNSQGFDDGNRIHVAGDLPVALAIAASSAFPPLFPPVNISRDRLRAKLADFPLEEHLTDGGVFDNLGIAKMTDLMDQRSGPATIIVSDASAVFDWKLGPRISTIIDRTTRTTDILMSRVAKLMSERISSKKPKVIQLSISDIVSQQDLDGLLDNTKLGFQVQSDAVQKLVARIRTDLDAFSWCEMCSLIRHGYEVGLKRLAAEGLLSKTFRANDPCISHFPQITWPTTRESMSTAAQAKQAIRVATSLKNGQTIIEEGSREIAALVNGDSTAPTKVAELENGEIKVRHRLEDSCRRSLRLWSFSDGLCWLVMALCAMVLATSVWLLR